MHNMMVSKEEDLRPLTKFLLDWSYLLKTEEQIEAAKPRKQTVEEKIKIAEMWVTAFNSGPVEQPEFGPK